MAIKALVGEGRLRGQGHWKSFRVWIIQWLRIGKKHVKQKREMRLRPGAHIGDESKLHLAHFKAVVNGASCEDKTPGRMLSRTRARDCLQQTGARGRPM